MHADVMRSDRVAWSAVENVWGSVQEVAHWSVEGRVHHPVGNRIGEEAGPG
jgi:hypothetical protein